VFAINMLVAIYKGFHKGTWIRSAEFYCF